MSFLAFAGSVQILPDLALVVHIVMILVMIWILNRTFFGPVNRVLAERSKREGGRMTETDEMISSANKKEESFRDSMLDARNEGYKLIEDERISAVKARQEKVAAAKTATAEELEAGLGKLTEETEAASKQISEEAEKMAEKIKETILKAA